MFARTAHLLGFVCLLSVTSQALSAERPNIILMMVDDMGFSDLGCYGSEIDTPNINALAAGGVRFAQFYNTARCCPTRATLMTGLHPHQAGIGHMTNSPAEPNPKRVPAYQGYLNHDCVTLAEVLGDAGYATLMTGKWHLGLHDQNRWPLQRGFEKFFGCIPGATRYFYPDQKRGMTFGNHVVKIPKSTTDEAFYTTDAFTDYAIRFIDEHEKAESDKPFFLYLAYTAPHWPLQAFEDDIAKYRGKYKQGWDNLRQQRYERQIELGLIDPRWELSPRTSTIPAWDMLPAAKQDEMDLKMAIYAAMIDRIDQNVGKLRAYLSEKDLMDNTLIVFLSDNGACAEGGVLGRGEYYDVQKRNQQPANSYGEAWANASCTPFRLYKHYAHEGGTSSPFFMHWPAAIAPRGEWYQSPAQLIDIMPTLLDVAGATYPTQYHGNEILPGDGISLRPAFAGQPLNRENPLFIEHENNAFVRDGKWKLVGRNVARPKGVQADRWELYDLEADRTETTNLVEQYPEIAEKMATQWKAWATRVQVYPKP